MAVQERKTVAEMFGEAIREIEVLVAVFIPLDVLVAEGRFSWRWFLATVAIATPLFFFGIVLERIRRVDGGQGLS